MRKGEAVHRALTSALVYVRDAEREMKRAMIEARENGQSGKLTGDIQAQLDVVEQLQGELENMVIGLMAAVLS